MEPSYVLLRGFSSRSLFCSGAALPQVAAIMQQSSIQMKKIAVHLAESGVPIRNILMPYIDTVLLQETTLPYYFGERMLIAGEWTEFAFVQARSQLADMPVKLQVERVVGRAQLHSLLARRAMPIPESLCEQLPLPTLPIHQIVCYTFAAGRMKTLPQYETDCRRMARAVLALGDILGRTVQKNGGCILRCAEHELICGWPSAEPGGLSRVLQETYQNQLLPTLGGAERMKRTVYAAEETV